MSSYNCGEEKPITNVRNPSPGARLHQVLLLCRLWIRYWPHLPIGPHPPCRSHLIRCRAAPSALALSSHTAGSGSLHSRARRLGGTAWSHQSLSSWRWRRGWEDNGPASGSGNQPLGEATSGHCTVPANENVNVRWVFFYTERVKMAALLGQGRLPVHWCLRQGEQGFPPMKCSHWWMLDGDSCVLRRGKTRFGLKTPKNQKAS